MSTNPNARKILVVEDEALLLFSIADDLRDAGFDVAEAGNADVALNILATDPAIGLIFTDIDMPGSMDGLGLSAAVKLKWPPVRIIVTSGKERPAPGRLPPEGIFIPKPYTPTGVAAAIHAMLA